MGDGPRPLDIERIAAAGDRAVMVDMVLPLAAEVDLGTGEITATWTWDLPPEHRGRPTTHDVALAGGQVVVASPAAGGVVRIDRTTGATTVVPLDGDAGRLLVDDDLVWAVGHPDADRGPALGRRGVEWEGPPAWVARAQAQFEGDDDVTDDEEEIVGAPTPVWRLGPDGAERLDLGGDVTDLAATGGTLVAVVRRPTDPLVKVADTWWSVGFQRPAAVVRRSPGGDLDVLGTLPDEGGLVADGGRIWLIGGVVPEASVVRPVDLAGGRLGEPVRLRTDADVLGVARGVIVCEGYHRPLTVELFDPGGARRRVTGPPVRYESGVVAGGGAWWVAEDGRGLVGLDPGTGAVRAVPVVLDCRPFMADPTVPPGIDPATYEAECLAWLRDSFLDGWRKTETGARLPFIDGVTFEAVDLRDAFPDTAVVAVFRSDERPGIRFARRFPLYDDLGNPRPPGDAYADLDLMEDVEAAGWGLPQPAACLPDGDGLVWF